MFCSLVFFTLSACGEFFLNFRTRVKLQFQHPSKMAKGNFFDLYFGNSDSGSEFEGFNLEFI